MAPLGKSGGKDAAKNAEDATYDGEIIIDHHDGRHKPPTPPISEPVISEEPPQPVEVPDSPAEITEKSDRAKSKQKPLSQATFAGDSDETPVDLLLEPDTDKDQDSEGKTSLQRVLAPIHPDLEDKDGHPVKPAPTPSVHVPGGVEPLSMSPEGFFTSKYPKRRPPRQPAYRQPTPGGFASGTGGLAAPQPAKQPLLSFNKKIITVIIGAVAGVVLLSILLYVFLVQIPSRPENAYGRAMGNTASALDNLLSKLMSPKTVSNLSNVTIEGSMERTIDGAAKSGVISGVYQSGDAELQIRSSSSDASAQDETISLVSLVKQDNGYLDLYVKGTNGPLIGLEQYLPGVPVASDAWSRLPGNYTQAYFDQYRPLFGFAARNASANVKSSEAGFKAVKYDSFTSAAEGLTSSIKDFLLSTGDSSVFTNPVLISEEEADSGLLYRYVVTIDPVNLEAYCNKSMDGLANSVVFKQFFETGSAEIPSSTDYAWCKTATEQITKNNEVEIWVNKNRRLIEKIRISSGQNPDTYSEIGQKVASKSRAEIYLIRSNAGASSQMQLNLGIDLDSGATTVNYISGNIAGTSSYSLSLKITPASDEKVHFRPYAFQRSKRRCPAAGL